MITGHRGSLTAVDSNMLSLHVMVVLQPGENHMMVGKSITSFETRP